MPLSSAELNRVSDHIGRNNLTIYLHTTLPTNADNDLGRVTTGGGSYASGATISSANISNATNGDITVTANIDFGTSNANLGTIVGYSLFRGSEFVGWGDIPSTTVNNGDSFIITANSLVINGSTT